MVHNFLLGSGRNRVTAVELLIVIRDETEIAFSKAPNLLVAFCKSKPLADPKTKIVTHDIMDKYQYNK